MSLKTDESGFRRLELEYEVPGTPEQVWQAIATGPGITSWFVPTKIEERVGGAVTFHLGEGMDSNGVVTAWEPPGRFAYEEPDWSPGAPPLATEHLVETRSGGICVVRIVHSLFTSSDEWDDQIESFEGGWTPFIGVLRLVLTHFAGQPCASFRVMNPVPLAEAEAWEALRGALGTAPFTGTEERGQALGKNENQTLLRLSEPAPGIALIGAYSWAGSTQVAMSVYLFGDQAAEVVAREEPRWKEWMASLFTPAGVASPS